VGAFIVAAILTPPDVFTQSMMAVPLLLLYEISIVASWIIGRRRRASVKPVPEPG
jgi:sec-independent protein translocase protein TatC